MDPAEIKDEDTLRAWLETRPQAEAVQIAHRAAMRVLPVFWEWSASPRASKLDVTALPVARTNLITNVAAVYSTDAVRAASIAAVHAADNIRGYHASGGVAHVARSADDSAVTAAENTPAADASHAAEAADVALLEHTRDYLTRLPLWLSTRADAAALAAGAALESRPLWLDDNPLAETWETTKARLREAPEDWSFWIGWYEAALTGTPPDWDLLERIALIPAEDWDKGPAHLNALIAGIVEEHGRSALAEAALADFEFDAVLRLMQMVGFADDAAHLRNPETVQAFLDDIGEVEDGFQDFADFAAAATPGRNAAGLFVEGAEKVLGELRRTRDRTHIRARRLLTLASYLHGFSLEEDARADLGTNLGQMLDTNLGLLRDVCRKHFAPSLMRLSALDGISLGDHDPAEMLARLRAALDRLRAAQGDDLVPMSPEAQAVFGDLLSELETLVAAIPEADTDAFREDLRGRFARAWAAATATAGRYAEKARPHAARANRALDGLIVQFRRVKTIDDLLNWLEGLFPGGPPPT